MREGWEAGKEMLLFMIGAFPIILFLVFVVLATVTSSVVFVVGLIEWLKP